MLLKSDRLQVHAHFYEATYGPRGITIVFVHAGDCPERPKRGGLPIPCTHGTAAQSACSQADEWDDDRGRKIALARAFKKAGFDRLQRTDFWQSYLARHRP